VSVGVTGKAYSLSGAFTTMGKLTVIVMFLLGKNRALPEISDPVVSFSFPQLEAALEIKSAEPSPTEAATPPRPGGGGSPSATPGSPGSGVGEAQRMLEAIHEEGDERESSTCGNTATANQLSTEKRS
jgi:hypothetical protein